MELEDYLRILRAHWIAVLAFVISGAGAGAAYTLTQTPVYCADATGFVTAGGASDGVQASVGDSLAKSRAASYVNLATSRAVAETVIEELGLPDSPASLVTQITVEQPLNTVLLEIRGCSGSPAKAQALADAWVRGVSTRVAQLENPEGVAAPGVLGVEPVEAAGLPSSPVSPVPRRLVHQTYSE